MTRRMVLVWASREALRVCYENHGYGRNVCYEVYVGYPGYLWKEVMSLYDVYDSVDIILGTENLMSNHMKIIQMWKN